MSKNQHTIRVYKGDAVVAWLQVEDKYYDTFNQAFTHYNARIEPIINMVDESFKDEVTGEWVERHEFQKVVSFEIKEPSTL